MLQCSIATSNSTFLFRMMFVESITKRRLQLTTIYVEVYLYVKPAAQGFLQCLRRQRGGQKVLFLPLLPVDAMESHHIAAWGFHQNKRHDVMVSAIVRATLRLSEPIWVRGNSRRLKKNHLSSPYIPPRLPASLLLRATMEAAARRLGKVWQPKSIQGSVKHRLVSSASTCYGGGWGSVNVKGRAECLGYKLAKRFGCDLPCGVTFKIKDFHTPQKRCDF